MKREHATASCLSSDESHIKISPFDNSCGVIPSSVSDGLGKLYCWVYKGEVIVVFPGIMLQRVEEDDDGELFQVLLAGIWKNLSCGFWDTEKLEEFHRDLVNESELEMSFEQFSEVVFAKEDSVVREFHVNNGIIKEVVSDRFKN